MDALTENRLLNYLENKQRTIQQRLHVGSLTFSERSISEDIGIPLEGVQALLDALKDRGRVHRASPGQWCLGKGI